MFESIKTIIDIYSGKWKFDNIIYTDSSLRMYNSRYQVDHLKRVVDGKEYYIVTRFCFTGQFHENLVGLRHIDIKDNDSMIRDTGEAFNYFGKLAILYVAIKPIVFFKGLSLTHKRLVYQYREHLAERKEIRSCNLSKKELIIRILKG